MKKYKKANLSTPKAMLLSVVFSFLILIIFSLAASAIVSSLKNPSAAMPIASLSAFLLCGFSSGFIISRKRGDGGIIFSLLCGIIFVLISIIVSLIIGKGHINGFAFMNSLCYILVLTLGAFISAAKGKKTKRNRR